MRQGRAGKKTVFPPDFVPFLPPAPKKAGRPRRSRGNAGKPAGRKIQPVRREIFAAQKRIRSSIQLRTSLRGTRTCSMVSRSRMVTDWVSSVSKSTQMQKGVPISSCRR